MTDYLTWIGIAFCLSQSSIFSGLNIACFSVTRLRLEIEAANGNKAAETLLGLRQDSNFLLTTILWGNVGINVLLTLLSNSVMVGLTAFLFSTVAITIGGEIVPQAYFSRHALRMASLLTPVLRFYQILLYVVAKPSAMLLDLWLGKEGVQYFRERDLRSLLHRHITAAESDLDAVEGIGALNFLAIDDVPISQEGEPISEKDILKLNIVDNHPQFFEADDSAEEGQRLLLERVLECSSQWIIIVGKNNYPAFALDGNAYLRALLKAGDKVVDPFLYCHNPVVVEDERTRLGAVLSMFKSNEEIHSDAPLKKDVILLWSANKRAITGADILGRLLKGIGLYGSLGQRLEKR